MKNSLILGNQSFIIRDMGSEMNRNQPIKLRGGAIMLCKSGHAELIVNTKKYNISTSSEAVLMSGSFVSINNNTEDFSCTIFYFSQKMFFQASSKIKSFLFHHIVNVPVYHYPPDAVKSMEHYFVLIKRMAADTANRYRDVIVMYFLRIILLDIYDKIQRDLRVEEHSRGHTHIQEIFNKFMDLLITFGVEHHDVKFYADNLCITTRYLTYITTEIANKNPKQIIDSHVIQEIKIMLTFSDMTLQQIADYFHFPDHSYLGRYFKHHTKYTLSGYRAKIMEM